MKRLASLLASGLVLASLAGCGPKSNLVSLEYISTGRAETLCTQPVAVGTFLDMRENKNLGRDNSHVLYPAGGSVEQWVADAFEKEMAARGCEVSRSDQPSPFTPDLVLKGEVLDLAVVRDGFDYTVNIDLAVKLFRTGEPVYHKVYQRLWERTFVTPSETRFRDLLRQGLQDLLNDALLDLKPLVGGV